MTYSIVEVHKVTCDECDDEESTTFHPDYDNITSEELWVSSLKEKGWVHDKGTDTHICPHCGLNLSKGEDDCPKDCDGTVDCGYACSKKEK